MGRYADRVRAKIHSNNHTRTELPVESPPMVESQWESPIPLAEIPAALHFPVDVLPARLRGFVNDAAAALACPEDYVAVPLVTLAGAAIGASRPLSIKDTWRERPCLYTAIVAPPGSTKTPALSLVANPFYAEQGRRFVHYRRERIA